MGVGFFLNVHEGPQSISKLNKVKIQKGMILSNEPGYYKKVRMVLE
jgi:Xaa-Pro aminopeptidase